MNAVFKTTSLLALAILLVGALGAQQTGEIGGGIPFMESWEV